MKDVKFEEPSQPYTKLFTETSDFSWISQKTGNTIAMLSECESTRMSPKDLAMDTAQAIDQLDILKSEPHTHKNLQGHLLHVKGIVDNSAVEMTILTFQDAKCILTLTYGGLEKNYASESSIFENFKASLVFP